MKNNLHSLNTVIDRSREKSMLCQTHSSLCPSSGIWKGVVPKVASPSCYWSCHPVGKQVYLPLSYKKSLSSIDYEIMNSRRKPLTRAQVRPPEINP
jgi:hypothetical protein